MSVPYPDSGLQLLSWEEPPEITSHGLLISPKQTLLEYPANRPC